ncbi:hypothetical protein [Wenjunlia tyrosinilytica]|nr:hypothetical protein [Wenjunlia tyrosinilytica]
MVAAAATDYRASPPPRRGAQRADDYDSWCEKHDVCGRLIDHNHTIAEVKGNVVYGNQNGFIGSFDLVNRQAFDGEFPRWRSLIDWDYGPQVQPDRFPLNCRINISHGPDDYCGKNEPVFASIDRGFTRSWNPSSSRYMYNEARLRDGRKHHDDMTGMFWAHGHDAEFKIRGAIHTGRWSKCNTGHCKYYQVPWKA